MFNYRNVYTLKKKRYALQNGNAVLTDLRGSLPGDGHRVLANLYFSVSQCCFFLLHLSEKGKIKSRSLELVNHALLIL